MSRSSTQSYLSTVCGLLLLLDVLTGLAGKHKSSRGIKDQLPVLIAELRTSGRHDQRPKGFPTASFLHFLLVFQPVLLLMAYSSPMTSGSKVYIGSSLLLCRTLLWLRCLCLLLPDCFSPSGMPSKLLVLECQMALLSDLISS